MDRYNLFEPMQPEPMKRVWRVTVEGIAEVFENVDDALGYVRGCVRENSSRQIALDSVLMSEQEYLEAVQ